MRIGLLLVLVAAALPAGLPIRKAPPWEKPRELARNLFLENCSVCHEIAKPKSAKIGPSLLRFKRVPVERTEPFRQYIQLKVRNGGIVMPAFKDLTDDQIRAIAGYLLPEK